MVLHVSMFLLLCLEKSPNLTHSIGVVPTLSYHIVQVCTTVASIVACYGGQLQIVHLGSCALLVLLRRALLESSTVLKMCTNSFHFLADQTYVRFIGMPPRPKM